MTITAAESKRRQLAGVHRYRADQKQIDNAPRTIIATEPMKAYRSPLALRINQARAAAEQKPLIGIPSNARGIVDKRL